MVTQVPGARASNPSASPPWDSENVLEWLAYASHTHGFIAILRASLGMSISAVIIPHRCSVDVPSVCVCVYINIWKYRKDSLNWANPGHSPAVLSHVMSPVGFNGITPMSKGCMIRPLVL